MPLPNQGRGLLGKPPGASPPVSKHSGDRGADRSESSVSQKQSGRRWEEPFSKWGVWPRGAGLPQPHAAEPAGSGRRNGLVPPHHPTPASPRQDGCPEDKVPATGTVSFASRYRSRCPRWPWARGGGGGEPVPSGASVSSGSLSARAPGKPETTCRAGPFRGR